MDDRRNHQDNRVLTARVLLFASSLCFSLIPLRVIHWPFLDHTRVGSWSLAGLGPSATNQQLVFPLKPEKTGRVLLVFRWPPSAPCARPRSQHQLCRSDMEGGGSYSDAPTSPTPSVTPVISWQTPWSQHPPVSQDDELTPSFRHQAGASSWQEEQQQQAAARQQESLQREREHFRGQRRLQQQQQQRQASLELLGALSRVVGRRENS